LLPDRWFLHFITKNKEAAVSFYRSPALLHSLLLAESFYNLVAGAGTLVHRPPEYPQYSAAVLAAAASLVAQTQSEHQSQSELTRTAVAPAPAAACRAASKQAYLPAAIAFRPKVKIASSRHYTTLLFQKICTDDASYCFGERCNHPACPAAARFRPDFPPLIIIIVNSRIYDNVF